MSYVTLNGDIYIRPTKTPKKSFRGLNMRGVFRTVHGVVKAVYITLQKGRK